MDSYGINLKYSILKIVKRCDYILNNTHTYEGLFDYHLIFYPYVNEGIRSLTFFVLKRCFALQIDQMLKKQLSRYHLRTILVPGRNVAFEEHKNILAALKNRDETAAEHS
jgi:hypothetical protein